MLETDDVVEPANDTVKAARADSDGGHCLRLGERTPRGLVMLLWWFACGNLALRHFSLSVRGPTVGVWIATGATNLMVLPTAP